MPFDLNNFLNEFKTRQPLSIGGIAIGSLMAEISYKDINSSRPDVNYPRIDRGDKIIKILDDGIEQELSPAHRYNEVEQYGGWLRTNGISWYIKNRTVMRYVILGDQLSSFNIQSEDQIVKNYGNPEYKAMSSSGFEYYYLQSQLTIVWSKKEGKLDSIRVGDFTKKKESLEDDLLNGVLYVAGIRKIHLSSVKQRHTYEGLLEGRPTDRMNNKIIKQAMEDARSYSSSNVHLIEPPRVKIELNRPYPFGEPENIPTIRCIAEFESLNPVKDEDANGSTLTLVWFQSRFAMPIDESVRSKIESLNWEQIATDIYH